jgi:HAMP domain-containing protein
MKSIKALTLAKKGYWLGLTFLAILAALELLHTSLQKTCYTYIHDQSEVIRQGNAVSLLELNPSLRTSESTRQQLLYFNEILSGMQQAGQDDLYNQLLPVASSNLNIRLQPLRQGWLTYLEELSHAKVDQNRLASILAGNKRNYPELSVQLEEREVQVREYMQLVILSEAGLLVAFFIITASFFFKQIISPLREIAQVAQSVALGDLTRKVEYKSNDEVGKAAQAINQIIDYQGQLSAFAQGIGKGNYQAVLPTESKEGSLGAVLSDMQQTLREVSLEERKRKWVTEGLATFGELFRNHQADLKVLGREFIIKLVNYLGANQGALFLLNQEEGEEPFLEPLSAYAWERQRFLRQRIALGEGMVGQSAREADTLYITEVPEDYIRITSGLGRAVPRSILLVPLRAGEQVQGVIEIASFRPIETFEIEFVEKIGQIAASTLTMARTNAQTRSLLEEAQRMNEQLKSQEEFLREMSEKLEYAKQEMYHQIRNLEAEKAKNMALLEGCVDGVICFDGRGKVEFINKAAEEIWLVNRQEILQNSIKQLLPLRIAGSEIAFTGGNTDKTIANRTEVSFRNYKDQDVDVLLTLSRAKVEEEYAFTLFVQKISVDLF